MYGSVPAEEVVILIGKLTCWHHFNTVIFFVPEMKLVGTDVHILPEKSFKFPTSMVLP